MQFTQGIQVMQVIKIMQKLTKNGKLALEQLDFKCYFQIQVNVPQANLIERLQSRKSQVYANIMYRPSSGT